MRNWQLETMERDYENDSTTWSQGENGEKQLAVDMLRCLRHRIALKRNRHPEAQDSPEICELISLFTDVYFDRIHADARAIRRAASKRLGIYADTR
jgi:hypothetical protein